MNLGIDKLMYIIVFVFYLFVGIFKMKGSFSKYFWIVGFFCGIFVIIVGKFVGYRRSI